MTNLSCKSDVLSGLEGAFRMTLRKPDYPPIAHYLTDIIPLSELGAFKGLSEYFLVDDLSAIAFENEKLIIEGRYSLDKGNMEIICRLTGYLENMSSSELIQK